MNNLNSLGDYAIKQQKIISELQDNFEKGSSKKVTVVEPVKEYISDSRQFLGVFAFPPQLVVKKIQSIQNKLHNADPRQFYIPEHALHMTLKNIRTISDPPNFSSEGVSNAKTLLSSFITMVQAVLKVS